MTRASIMVFILACSLLFSVFSSANDSRADEIELESYVPLRMHFVISHGRPRNIGTLSGDGKINFVTYRNTGNTRREFIIEPTEKEWREFFNVVEGANIWGLEKNWCDCLPANIQMLPSTQVSWQLELEYPDRVLEIMGWTRIITERAEGLRESYTAPRS